MMIGDWGLGIGIGEGLLMPKAYMFGKSRDKVKIPVGASRDRKAHV